MAQTIKLKRSSVSGNTPSTSDLALGEIGINTYDGKIFIKKDDGSASIVEVGGSSGTVTDAFKTIAVSGQTSVVADSATDTLTFVAGTNMSITTSAGGDSITFASTGSSGSATFIGLSDSPSNFSGAAGKYLKVNSSANALEYDTLTFSDIGSTPSTLAGYGITDSLQLGTSSTTALAGNTSIPAAITDLSISDGSSGQVLQTDGSGNFSFTNQTGGNSFATIAISGQSSVVADQGSDTLTLVAGNNVTLSTNAGGDSITIASTGSGASNALSSSFNLFEYTATNNQTTFSGADSNSNTLAYDLGSGTILPKVFVYYNGILLDHTVDYTATNGTSVVFTEACSTGDTIQIGAYVSSISVAADLALVDNQKALFGAGNDLQIYHDGSNSHIKNNTGNLTLDVVGAIILDADNTGLVDFKDGGTHFGRIENASSDFKLESRIQDKDIVLVGNDGGVGIEALRLDMSDGGAAHFINDVRIADSKAVRFGTDQDFRISSDGSNTYLVNSVLNQDIYIQGRDSSAVYNMLTMDMSARKSTFAGIVSSPTGFERGNMFITGNEIDVGSGDLLLDVAGTIKLDADSGSFYLQDAGNIFGIIEKAGSDLRFRSGGQDADIVFMGNDGGSLTTALTLDMSDGGSAIFNNHISLGDNKQLKFGASNDVLVEHNASNNNFQITNYNTSGGMVIQNNASAGGIALQPVINENAVYCAPNGAVQLYHNGSSKLQTTSTGITVAGTINSSTDVALSRDGSTSNRIRISNGTVHTDTDLSVTGNLSVSGNFNIAGDINQTSVTTLDVTDKTITVANNAGSAANANDAGLIVDTGGTNPSLLYKSSGDKFVFNKPLDVTGTVTSTGLTTSGNFLKTGTNGNYTIAANGNDFYYGRNGTNYHIANTANGGFQFLTGSSSAEALRITSAQNINIANGSLMVGATTATATNTKLHIKTSTNQNIEFEETGSKLRISALNDARSANVPLQFASSGFEFLTGNASFSGVVTANAGVVVDNITIDANKIATNQAGGHNGNFTIDASGDIILDADGGDVLFKDNGTHFGSIYTTSTPSAMYIQSLLSGQSLHLASIGGIGLSLSSTKNVNIPQSLMVGSTTAPTGYRLVVENTSEDLLKLHNSTDGLDSLISFTNSGGTLARIQGIDNGGLGFDVGNNAGGIISNAMSIDSSGNSYFRGAGHTNLEVRSASLSTKAFIQTVQDSDIRIGSSTNHPVAFYSNSVERMRLDTSGNVGIGTTSPNAYSNQTTLTINGTTYGRIDLETGGIVRTSLFSQAANTTLSVGSGFFTIDCGGSERVRLDTSGNVGIGTTQAGNMHTNASKLVVGTGSGDQGMSVFAGTSVGRYAFARSAANNSDAFDGGMSYDGNRNLKFHTNANATRMTINGSGNVGIGTTSPAAKLDIVGGHLRLDAGYSLQWNDSFERIEQSDGHLEFFVNNGEAMTLDTNGLGIGTTAPSARLDVVTNSTVWAGEFIQSNTSNGDGVLVQIGSTASADYALSIRSNAGNTSVLAAKADGNVGIGTFTPATKFHVSAGSTNANTIARLQQGTTAGNYSGIEVGRTDGSGNVQTTTAVFGGVPISGTAGIVLGSHTTALPAVAIQSANSSNGHIVFNPKGQEKVRITADGNVGIGESIPTEKLHVGGNIKMQASTAIVTYQNAANTWNIGLDAADASFKFKDGTDERIRIDASGNVGIAKTSLTTWSSGYNALQIGGKGFVGAHSSSDLYLGQNASFNSGWKYESSVAASLTQHSGGKITQFVAPAGTAGAAISWNRAIDIDPNGRVGIGLTPTNGIALKIGNAANNSAITRVTNGTVHVDLTASSSGKAFLEVGTNHPLILSTNAQERMQITTSGYIHMAGASDVRLTLGSQGTAGNNDANWIRGNGNALSFNSAAGNYVWEVGGATKMTLTSAGKLFVGDTTASDAQLRVKQTTNSQWAANIINHQAIAYGLSIDTGSSSALTTFNFAAYTPAGAGFFVKNSGNVGIGTSSPNAGLEVLRAGGGKIRISETAARYVEIIGYAEGAANGSTMAFQTIQAGTSTSTERMRIDSSGNVGIGASAPRATLDVRGGHSSTVNEAISFGRTDDNYRYNSIYSFNTSVQNSYLSFRIHDGGSSVAQTETMVLKPGKVGIGTNDPAVKLQVKTTADGTLQRFSRSGVCDWDISIGNTPITTGGSSGDLEIIPQNGNMGFTVGTTSAGLNGRFRDGTLTLGKGIKFNSDTAAANELDDYEEGTWTPTLSASATNPTPTAVNVNSADYTKIGNTVFIRAYISVTLSSVGAGGASIEGLPFTVKSGTYAPAMFTHGTLILSSGGYFGSGTNRITAIGNNSVSSIAYAGTGSIRYLMITGQYETTA